MKKEKINILVVDDVESSLLAVEKGLSRSGYKIQSTSSSKEALALIKKNEFHVIVTDLKMPDYSGEDIFKAAKEKQSETIVIIMTGFSSVESAVELMHQGVFHYLKKPIQIMELRELIEKGLDKQELVYHKDSVDLELNYGTGVLVSQAKSMKKILEQIISVAKTKSTILVSGESGTGKEAITRIIHNNSPRKFNPFIAVNCSAFSESLLESQLFGHEKGAFTGASAISKGIFESADTGTIFLDEVGEMSMAMQAKLLRVLETKEFMRVGSTKSIYTDIRIIAASNRDLLKEVEKKNFREDLYYRLSVINIYLPPLRERAEDIPILAQNFLKQLAKENDMEEKQLSISAIDLLKKYDWPGNVRELKNFMERLFVTCQKLVIGKSDVLSFLPQFDITETDQFHINVGDSMDEIEKKAIIETLKQTNGNRTKTAEILKIGLRTLQRKIKDYQINA